MNGVASSRVPGGVDGDKFSGTRADEFSDWAERGGRGVSAPILTPPPPVSGESRLISRVDVDGVASSAHHRPRVPRA